MGGGGGVCPPMPPNGSGITAGKEEIYEKVYPVFQSNRSQNHDFSCLKSGLILRMLSIKTFFFKIKSNFLWFCPTYSQIAKNNVSWEFFDLKDATKGQLISKANFKVFIWTKTQRKYFCISAQASKMGQTSLSCLLLMCLLNKAKKYYRSTFENFIFCFRD